MNIKNIASEVRVERALKFRVEILRLTFRVLFRVEFYANPAREERKATGNWQSCLAPTPSSDPSFRPRAEQCSAVERERGRGNIFFTHLFHSFHRPRGAAPEANCNSGWHPLEVYRITMTVTITQSEAPASPRHAQKNKRQKRNAPGDYGKEGGSFSIGRKRKTAQWRRVCVRADE